MEVLFIKLLNMSVTAGYVILAAIALRLVLRKAPKAFRCFLWALAGVRLVCPVSLESALSLVPSAETITPVILYSETPSIKSGIYAVNSFVNPAISGSMSPAPGAAVNPIQSIMSAASVVWIIGAAALLLYGIVSYLLLRRNVASSVPIYGNIREYDAFPSSSPFVLGLLRPKIYVPFGLDGEKKDYVIAHETAHIRRGDHLVKPFAFLLLTLYWFNPLVWAAYILLCRDIELACDERVISGLGLSERKAYSKALFEFSVKSRMVSACPVAFGEAGIKERVKNVMNYKKPAFWIILIAAAAVIAAAVFFLTNPPKKDDKSPVTPGTAYAFDEVLFISPLSSYIPFGGTGKLYIIDSSGSFLIVNEDTGETEEEYSPIDWTGEEITAEDWNSRIEKSFPSMMNISIEDYSTRIKYDISSNLQLYLMDDEVWLIKGGDMIWSIYKLKEIDYSVSGVGGADGPESVTVTTAAAIGK